MSLNINREKPCNCMITTKNFPFLQLLKTKTSSKDSCKTHLLQSAHIHLKEGSFTLGDVTLSSIRLFYRRSMKGYLGDLNEVPLPRFMSVPLSIGVVLWLSPRKKLKTWESGGSLTSKHSIQMRDTLQFVHHSN